MAARHVLILVPGTMGSELQLHGRVIWPGSILKIWGLYPNLEDLLNPDAVPTDVLRRVCLAKQYVQLIDFLEALGYPEKSADGSGHRLVLFPYDWRKSGVDAARSLANLVSRIVSVSPDAEVTFMGHGMGGMVCRYYLESGQFSGEPGFDRIKSLLMMATPSGGAIAALETIVGIRAMPFLSRQQTQQMAGDARYPAAYESLPGPGTPFLWSNGAGDAVSPVDLYDPQVVSALGLSKENLSSVIRFRSGMSLERKPHWVRYFGFVGTHFKTSSACYLKGSTIVSIKPDRAGDGTLPVWSTTLPNVQQIQVGGSHATIYKDHTLQHYLRTILALESPAARSPQPMQSARETIHPQLHLRDQWVNAGQPIHLSVSLANTASGSMSHASVEKPEHRGEVRLQQILLDDDGCATLLANPTVIHTISLPDADSDRVEVQIIAPAAGGPYRVGYFPPGSISGKPADHAIVLIR